MSSVAERGQTGRPRVRDGLLSIVTLAGGAAATLVWTMSAGDPYWRLFQVADMPAPVYRDGVPEGGATTSALAHSDTTRSAPSPNTESVPAGPELPPVAVPLPAPDLELAVAPELAPRPLQGDDPSEEGAQAALARTLPPLTRSPMALEPPRALAAIEAPQILRDDALTPVPAGAAPSPLVVAADAESEGALGLGRSQRLEIQQRLTLAGFDPGAHDGVFGVRTRAAIAEFERAWGYPPTGYLNEAVLRELNMRTGEAYAALRRHLAMLASGAPKEAPVPSRRLATAEKGCRRDAQGRIIERQSLACDLKGLKESFLSLGRLQFGERDEDQPKLADNARTRPLRAAGADR